ncbi:kinase-like domain-containing protein [Tricladium varicosporioides]|nr:kinase-like domain-containing protein [Hymenoscyphus varicosporioides]
MSQKSVAQQEGNTVAASLALPHAYGYCTLPVTALGILVERLSPPLEGQALEDTAETDFVDFYIPLAPFERYLLDVLDERWNLSASLREDDSFDALLGHLFHNWEWSYNVQSYLQAAFTNEDDPEKCENYQQMYEKGLHRMAWTTGYGRNLFRIASLKEVNNGFLQRLGSKPFWSIRFKPWDEDAKCWSILASMFLRNQPLMLFWMNAPERRRIFSRRNETLEWHFSQYYIWQIVRIFDLWSRRPSNSRDIVKLFSKQSSSSILEASLWNDNNENNRIVSYLRALDGSENTNATDSGDESTSTESNNIQKFREILDRILNANGASLEVIFESQMGTLRWHYGNLVCTVIRPIDIFRDRSEATKQVDSEREHRSNELIRNSDELYFEPASYLELINWDELSPVAMEDIPQRARQDLNNSGLDTDYKLVVWRSTQMPCLSYHFTGEETLLQRRLCDGFDDAGDCANGHIFLAMDLEGSHFRSDYLYYWALWNDSAITIEPATGKLKLLTTPRGCRYRRIFADFDELAALRSQRREVDLVNSINDTRLFLQRMLGSSYKSEYDIMLPYIPAQQISVLGHLGAGSFGSVVRATWQHPRSLEHEKPETVDVVLKRLHNDIQASEAFTLFLHELRVTYSGLTGSSTGCTEFYGVAEVNEASFPGVGGAGTCLCFVFERATEGSLLDYVKQKCLLKAWPEVVSAMADLFGGLNTLHNRDILHCDIHPGNILLTVRRTGYAGTGPSVCLCDFGLGKLIRNPAMPAGPSSTTGTMQINQASSAYKAPEVRRGQPYTKAADIFGAGVFMQRAFLSYERAASATGTGPVELPRKLWELCGKCTAYQPEKRPTAIEAVFEMERVHDDDFTEGKFDLVDMRELIKQGDNLVEGFSESVDTPGSTDLDSRFNVVISSDGGESFRYGS